jgi:hypothetical protein
MSQEGNEGAMKVMIKNSNRVKRLKGIRKGSKTPERLQTIREPEINPKKFHKV